MHQWFDDDGVRFAFPEGWTLSRDEHEQEVTLTVSGEGTSFWSLSLYPEETPVEVVIETAVAAFREEYEELDVYEAGGSLCGFPVESRTIEFVCLELINTAVLRAFMTPDFTVLVYYQGTDHELVDIRETLEAITTSLSVSFESGAD